MCGYRLGNPYLASRSKDHAVTQEYMREAEEQITILHQIAGQTLTVGRQTQTPISIHLLELAEVAIRIHHRRIAAKRAVIVKDLEQSQLVAVRPGEIVQVLSNLLGNALDAIEDAGKVTLHIRKRGRQLCLFISDNGHAISAEHLGRLFEPFFTTKNDRGNGLAFRLRGKSWSDTKAQLMSEAVRSRREVEPHSGYAFHSQAQREAFQRSFCSCRCARRRRSHPDVLLGFIDQAKRAAVATPLHSPSRSHLER